MSEPRWSDVEVGDALIAEHTGDSDVIVSGTVVEIMLGGSLYLAGMEGALDWDFWTLLDIIKPGPQLPTKPGSVIRYELNGPGNYVHYMLQGEPFGKKSWAGPWGHGYAEEAVADVATPWELVYDAGKK